MKDKVNQINVDESSTKDDELVMMQDEAQLERRRFEALTLYLITTRMVLQ